MDTFWNKLPRPFFVIAPMANVTDAAFRKLFAKYGKPDVTWTEFVSADGLVSPGRKRLLKDLEFSKKEKPIVAQLFTGHPEAMEKAAELVAKLGFDGIDINMGCPDRAVERQGGGASLIKDPKKAVAVLEAARRGVLKSGNPTSLRQKSELRGARKGKAIPVSVKTRIGYNKFDADWLRTILNQKLPVLTVHLRTRKEMSLVPAHWELMPEVIKLRNEISPETLIIGNGDVQSIAEAKEFCKKYGCDGVMIGRGIFGKPWFFENSHSDEGYDQEKTIEYRLKIMVEHAKLFEKKFKGLKNFEVMKKHFKAYVSGFDGAKELRVKLMEAETLKELNQSVKNHLKGLR